MAMAMWHECCLPAVEYLGKSGSALERLLRQWFMANSVPQSSLDFEVYLDFDS